MSKIRSIQDLQRDVNELKKMEDIYRRERTALSKNINSIKKQILKLKTNSENKWKILQGNTKEILF